MIHEQQLYFKCWFEKIRQFLGIHVTPVYQCNPSVRIDSPFFGLGGSRPCGFHALVSLWCDLFDCDILMVHMGVYTGGSGSRCFQPELGGIKSPSPKLLEFLPN